jgi:hypothetical protein
MLYLKHKVSVAANLCFNEHIAASRWYTWWAHEDSNLEPKDYESSALTIEL